jgi:hypothetical protein
VPAGDNGLGLKAWLAAHGLAWAGAYGLFWLTLAAFAAMTAGVFTPHAVLAALWLSLLQLFWNNFPLSGEHLLTQVILFSLVWVDSGAVWSVDAWRRRRAGDHAPPPLQPIAPLRLIRFQVALIYLSSGLWKLYSPLWRDGSALHYILNSNVFQRVPDLVTPAIEPLLTTATYVTLVWELAFAFALLYRPTRRIVLAMGVAIHLGMIATLEVGLFIYVVLSTYTAFLSPNEMPSLANRAIDHVRRFSSLRRSPR